MNKTKGILLVALVLTVIGGLGGWVAFSSADRLIEVSETKTLDQSFSAIAINADHVGVEIRPGKGEITEIELVGQIHKSVSYSLDADIEDGVMTVSADMNDQFSWFNFYPNNLKVVISLPEKHYHSLKSEGNSGMINLEGLQIDEIYCNTKNSSITLGTITSKTVTLESGAHLDLSDVQSDSIIARTSASIDLENVEANSITARTSAKITLSTSHLERHIDLDAGGSSIHVKTEQRPENVRFEVSGKGSINLLGGRYDGGVKAGDGDNLVRLIADGSITVEEAAK